MILATSSFAQDKNAKKQDTKKTPAKTETKKSAPVPEAGKSVKTETKKSAPVPEAGKAPLAGSSVHVDRIFLHRDMPKVNAYLHYRIVDVSSIKELVRRWYPKVYFANPPKTGNHRALGDIRDSITELKYYRATVFADQPGPDTAAAKEAAARLTAD